MKKKLIKFTIKYDSTIKSTIQKMNKSGHKTLVVCDYNYLFLGTISDGDLRRAILKYNFSHSINAIYNKKAIFFKLENLNLNKIKSLFIKKNIDLIPLVDNKGLINDIIFSNILSKKNNKILLKNKIHPKVPAVIMAGGKGSRMKPLNNILPKALMPFKDKTVLLEIIEFFFSHNIKNIFLSVNHQKNIIKTYIHSLNLKNKISYLNEKFFLGTAGSLKKMQKYNAENFFVINCDVLFNFNLKDFYNYHLDLKSDITVLCVNKISRIEYGVCKTDIKKNIINIIEKPNYNFKIVSGLYLINKKVLKFIKNDEYLDMNVLIERSIKSNLKVVSYDIADKQYMDIGTIDNLINNSFKFDNLS